MKKTIFAAIAASFLLGGCATSETATTGGTSNAKASNEDFVTGSRLKRSESNENYQGSKSMTGKDYRDYKASQGQQSN